MKPADLISEARAQIIWGEPASSVRNFLTGNGIPQGSPMSAVLSNIYMLDFDTALATKIKTIGGLYRRYCDDMLCVIPHEAQKDVEAFVTSEIQKAKLEVQAEKTGRHHFQLAGGRLTTQEPLKYLGFSFDGTRVLLRSAAVSRYYSKMRAGIKLAAQTMKRRNGLRLSHGLSPLPLKRRKLNILYTYVGRHNFPAYVYRAAKRFQQPDLKRQIRRHPKKLAQAIHKHVEKQVPHLPRRRDRKPASQQPETSM